MLRSFIARAFVALSLVAAFAAASGCVRVEGRRWDERREASGSAGPRRIELASGRTVSALRMAAPAFDGITAEQLFGALAGMPR